MNKAKKNKTKKSKKHGGNSYKSGTWVPFNNIKPDELCAICQDPLQSSEQISDKGLIYQLSCGHQFHNNCLNQFCTIYSANADKDREINRPTIFSCPICRQTTINEEDDCTTTDAYEENYLSGKEKYTTEEYTGISKG